MTVGRIAHASVGAALSQTEFESESAHTIGGVADLSIVRGATLVVAASDASAASKAMADYVCDGVDDDVQIQAAIDALPSGIQGAVELTEGNFNGGKIAIADKGKVWLRGRGTGATVYTLKDSENDNMLEITGEGDVYDTTVSDMMFDGNKSNQSSGKGIYVAGQRQVRLRDLKVRLCKGVGIHFNGSSYSCNTFRMDNIIVTENDGDGIYIQQVYNWAVRGTYSGSNGEKGFNIATGAEAVIALCASDLNAQRGIYVYGSKVLTIIGCPYIGANGNEGIELASTCREILIEGNVIVDNGSAGASHAYGINISGAADDVMIIGNRIMNDTSTDQDTGILIGASAERTLVTGNNVNGNQVAGIEDNASDSIIRNNIGYTTENWGKASISPDGSGNGTIAHGLAATPGYVAVHLGGDNVNGADPESVDGTNITVRIKDAAGADVTAGTFDVYWEARI